MPTETTVVTQPPHHWETGYIAGMSLDAAYFDEAGTPLGTLIRGTQVEYELAEDGRITVLLDDAIVYLDQGASIVADPAEVIPAHILYVRTAVNLFKEGQTPEFVSRITELPLEEVYELKQQFESEHFYVAENNVSYYLKKMPVS